VKGKPIRQETDDFTGKSISRKTVKNPNSNNIFFAVHHGQLGERRITDENGLERERRTTTVLAAMYLSNGEGQRDVIEVSERKHFRQTQRHLVNVNLLAINIVNCTC
jgi:hypothetical protein